MSVYPFIEAERAEQHNVAKACELLEVSRSAFYDHARHVPSLLALADAELAERIEAIHTASRGTYGWPRVHQALRREGVHVSRKRVARIMRMRTSLAGAGGGRPRPLSRTPRWPPSTCSSGPSGPAPSSTGPT